MKILKTKLKLAISLFLFAVVLLSPALAFAATDPCDDTTGANGNVSQAEVNKCLKQSPIVHDINIIVNFLSIGVGIIVTGVIILGGIQYITAGDNATAITAAKQRIINGLIALVTFIFTYALLQWLIPGGVFQ